MDNVETLNFVFFSSKNRIFEEKIRIFEEKKRIWISFFPECFIRKLFFEK